MEMHDNEQLIWRGHPSARSSIAFLLKWGFFALLPVAIAGIFKANDRGTGLGYWWWVAISVALLVLVVIADILRRAAVDYVLTTQRIRIRRGIISRREQSTVIGRVQSLNTNQGVLDRLLGIGSIDFETAGTEAQSASFSFRGVGDPHGLAAKFENYLIELRRAGSEGAAGA
jgi:uncharacterized membrane protein YdbT with pleckstrin-like domain